MANAVSQVGQNIHLVEVIPQKVEQKDATCSICFKGLEIGEIAYSHENAPHAFHNECLKRWLKIHPSCPYCRVNINPNSPCFETFLNSLLSKNIYRYSFIGLILGLKMLTTEKQNRKVFLTSAVVTASAAAKLVANMYGDNFVERRSWWMKGTIACITAGATFGAIMGTLGGNLIANTMPLNHSDIFVRCKLAYCFTSVVFTGMQGAELGLRRTGAMQEIGLISHDWMLGTIPGSLLGGSIAATYAMNNGAKGSLPALAAAIGSLVGGGIGSGLGAWSILKITSSEIPRPADRSVINKMLASVGISAALAAVIGDIVAKDKIYATIPIAAGIATNKIFEKLEIPNEFTAILGTSLCVMGLFQMAFPSLNPR